MTSPQRKPAPMITPLGVKMSERAARIYGWLAQNGMPFTTWSTDETVKRHAPKLREAIAYLENTMIDRNLGRQVVCDADVTSDQLLNMYEDLKAIMRRIPEARVT